MGENTTNEFPYKSLGGKLRKMREKLQETVAEVSGAVEIDATVLSDIEQGRERPAEDILMLLISYFSVKEEEAVTLWELAGYDRPGKESPRPEETTLQPIVVLPMDARIVYADKFRIDTNEFGVVMNFLQEAGPKGKPLAVSRIGMSREHAQKVLESLQQALQPKAPKSLPAPKKRESKEDSA